MSRGRKRLYKYFAADTETTVYEGQEYTEVWAAACCELNSEDVHIFHSLKEQFEYFISLKSNLIVWYHNLKFDGAFWLYFLLTEMGYKQALDDNNEFIKQGEMPEKSFRYTISGMGQWYMVQIKVDRYNIIELRDSFKLFPFSLKRIGQSFDTKHKKLEMEYEGLRYAGCPITDEEKQYIANDVLVLKEALEIAMQEGHTKLTIGSCCLSEYKSIMGRTIYNEFFPNIYEFQLDDKIHGFQNAGEWLRKTYRGGWCYLVPEKANKVLKRGCTFDVNSLYPSMMSSKSGNKYPVGNPVFWEGNFIPDNALKDECYYFIHIRTRFYIKKGYLPFIQIKGNLLYRGNECLKTSDVYDRKTSEYCKYIRNVDGEIVPTKVDLYLTMTDYILIKEHYDLVECEIIDGCYFEALVGIFDAYIDKYKIIKQTSKGAKRELAKLFLNNLYGKMAANEISDYKIAYIGEDRSLHYKIVTANDKTPGYIPVGSAITSYSRNFTIRAAQLNYHGPDKSGFVYADTDSIHCDCSPSQVQGLTIHPTDFCAWKNESRWDIGFFVRQKTYIEHIVEDDKGPVTPEFNVKCAGMSDFCKQLFLCSMGEVSRETLPPLTKEEELFLATKRTIRDFTIGLTIPGKLTPKNIPGGILLTKTTYEMRPTI